MDRILVSVLALVLATVQVKDLRQLCEEKQDVTLDCSVKRLLQLECNRLRSEIRLHGLHHHGCFVVTVQCGYAEMFCHINE